MSEIFSCNRIEVVVLYFGNKKRKVAVILYRVLIADPSVKDRTYVADKLENQCEIAFCDDGCDILRIIREFEPDVLFLDLQLPNGNGVGLLRDIRAFGNMIPAIITTPCLLDFQYLDLLKLQVVAILVKPYTVDQMIAHIFSAVQDETISSIRNAEDELNYILNRLGFHPGSTRYNATWHAIIQRYEHVDSSLTKEIYPTVAKLVNGGRLYVEKAIREAIRCAANTGDPELWKSFFPVIKAGEHPKNEDFIGRMVLAIRKRERPRKIMQTEVNRVSGI